MKIKDIADILEIIEDGGLMELMRTRHSSHLPWLTASLAKDIDTEYVISHSGEKTVSPLLFRFSDMVEKQQISTIEARTLVCDFIFNHYGENWTKIYSSYFETEYKPLENYSMIEQENAKTKIKTVSSNNSSVYGFDSEEPVPSNEAGSETETSSNADDNERKLTRSGNIGVTTSQQMLQSEIDLRSYDFIESIMRDLDTVLCLAIYE